MLPFLREANTAHSVTDIINGLYETLAPDTFSELFPVILTDRGTEFPIQPQSSRMLMGTYAVLCSTVTQAALMKRAVLRSRMNSFDASFLRAPRWTNFSKKILIWWWTTLTPTKGKSWTIGLHTNCSAFSTGVMFWQSSMLIALNRTASIWHPDCWRRNPLKSHHHPSWHISHSGVENTFTKKKGNFHLRVVCAFFAINTLFDAIIALFLDFVHRICKTKFQFAIFSPWLLANSGIYSYKLELTFSIDQIFLKKTKMHLERCIFERKDRKCSIGDIVRF